MPATLQLSRFTALTFVILAGCGGSPPPAAPTTTVTTTPPPGSASAAAESAPVAASAAPPATAAPSTASAAPPAEASAPAKPLRSLGDIITAPTVAYMINYSESAPKEGANTLCTGKSGGDPGKRAECMDKERDRFTADVLVFGKVGKELSFTVYRRARNNLTELSKARVTFDKDTESSVIVKIASEKGARPVFVGKKEFPVSASDSSIQLDDPQFGKLVYEARIGLVDKPAE